MARIAKAPLYVGRATLFARRIELEEEETRMRALGFLLLGCLWLARWLTERH